MKLTGLTRIFVAAGSAIALLSMFQNCSQVNFASISSKSLVQGGVTGTGTSPGSPGSTPIVAPPSDQGICVLTCIGEQESDDQDELHILSNSSSLSGNKMCANKPPVSASVCNSEDDEDGSGSPVKPVIQSVSSDDSHPKTACMSKTACQMIGAHLQKGKMVLMKVASNKVSSLRGSRFEAVHEASDCEDHMSDDDIKAQIEVDGK